MRIAHVIPGSGGSFYCGNCLRDSKFFQALRGMGHDVIKVPMYLPLFAHEQDRGGVPVFYGAVSIYLKQLIPPLRRAPAWVDGLLNAGPVLRLAARQAGSTRATGLEAMTISMLLGEEGEQREELDRMVAWLRDRYRPDVVHISNALLLGLVRRIKAELGVPVVCSLQDEDVWVDDMSPPNRERVWQLMAQRGREVDRFVSVSHYFAQLMQRTMGIEAHQLTTIHLGVDPHDYRIAPPGAKPRSIGYMSRMCHSNGLDLLVEAFILLRARPENADLTLTLTGGHTADDKPFLRAIRRRLRSQGLLGSVTVLDDFGEEGRRQFFDRVSALSVPVRNGEAFGIYLVEALASGVPIVQPPLGAFPEVVNLAGAGVVATGNTPQELAEALHGLLADPAARIAMGQRARTSVEEHFNVYRQAQLLARVYHEVASR